jgi:Fur family ferric uptake transcriptional regulator
LSSLAIRLRRESRKITGPRAAILKILHLHRHPLTTKEIHMELAAGSCDLATIYRAMQMLEKMGMVRRSDFGDGTARFELVAEGENHHVHHLICTQCAQAVKISECFPADIERRIAQTNGFAAVTHRLEFFGVCPACQK